MTYPKITKTVDGCYIASIEVSAGTERFATGRTTSKYATRTGALKALCEILHAEWTKTCHELYPFRPTGPCVCEGWGHPGGCPGCGTGCMGG